MAFAPDDRPDSAWELYHENSKNGRRMRPEKSPPAFFREPDGGPLLPLGEPTQLASSALTGPLALTHAAALLTHDGSERAPVFLCIHATGVAGLADGLYRHDASANGLRILRRGDLGARIAAALLPPPPGAIRLWLFVAGDLGWAAALHGERGYRLALIAAGERIAAVGETVGRLGLALSRPDFYDREIDGLLGLDGLSAATLAVLAAGKPAG